MRETVLSGTRQGRTGRESGFTLLDTMIAMLIVGLLAGVSAVVMVDFATQARVESVLSIVRYHQTQIDLEYRENGVMPARPSTIRPHEHPDIRRIAFTRRGNHRMFIKIRIERELYTPASNRLAEIWLLAEGDQQETLTWSCGSTPAGARAVPNNKLPSYCRDDIPNR